ncbi:helix-turn-helix domain-containing protein [Halomicrobium salinisoli]|nr:helix-turn-helix domain-containing protein [Halomicrobium salinisoli]
MEEVADELGITAQSFSDRLRRAQHTLVANTLRVTATPEPADG